MSWMMKCCLLVVLIDNCMNQEITYPERQAFKAKGRSVRIKCLVNQSTLKSTALHLYRAQSGGALQRILHFEAGTTTAKTEEAFGRRFTGAIKQNEVTLTVSALAPEDAGMYYCALWGSDNTQLDGVVEMHQQISLTKSMEKVAIINCDFPKECEHYIHWYQKKEGETLKRILYSRIMDGDQKLEQKMWEVKAKDKTVIIDCQFPSNCLSYIHWKVFGSGTRLYVTDVGKDKVNVPTLKAYKPSKIQGDKRTMVCQASKMFPDLVKFTWQTKTSTGGDWANVPDEQVIEQRDEVGKDNPPTVFVTSMITVDENTIKNNKYKCSVKHEGTTDPKTAYIDEGTSSPGSGVDPVEATCPPTTENTEQKQKSETTDEAPSLYLFLYAYGIMLMKNGLYFVAVSLYLFKRRFGKKNEST
ncbi:uncharacterized protein [Misgurnus anguillicaudatus]|uniref:uncharacterized protein n=1 Tax=Misgurnus anguillicaudatus TaxID=75329 RepID=UPI003CCFA5B5